MTRRNHYWFQALEVARREIWAEVDGEWGLEAQNFMTEWIHAVCS